MTSLLIVLATVGGLAGIYAIGHALGRDFFDGPTVGRRK